MRHPRTIQNDQPSLSCELLGGDVEGEVDGFVGEGDAINSGDDLEGIGAECGQGLRLGGRATAAGDAKEHEREDGEAEALAKRFAAAEEHKTQSENGKERTEAADIEILRGGGDAGDSEVHRNGYLLCGGGGRIEGALHVYGEILAGEGDGTGEAGGTGERKRIESGAEGAEIRAGRTALEEEVCAHAGKLNGLRGIGGVIRDEQIVGGIAGDDGLERDLDGASSAGRDGGSATIGGDEAAGHGESADIEIGAAGIGDGNGLLGAGGAQRLGIELERSGGESDGGGSGGFGDGEEESGVGAKRSGGGLRGRIGGGGDSARRGDFTSENEVGDALLHGEMQDFGLRPGKFCLRVYDVVIASVELEFAAV